MKTFFDHQTFSLLKYGGIPRYYAELISGINNTIDNEAYLPILVSNNVHLQEIGIQALPFFSELRVPKKLQTIYYLNKLYTIFKLKQKSYDIFHATYYDPYFLPHLKGRPFVVTFLDMIHERFGSQFDELAYDGIITKQKRLLANRADRIIAISESTKRDVVDILDIDPNKIDVIYLGSSVSKKLNNPGNKTLDPPYLLFVGNRSMYKNFDGLLKAIYPLLSQYNVRLICAGGKSFSKDEKILIELLKVSDKVEQRPIDDKNLSGLYKNAIAFIFPSLYEGFGLPVLEAFACDCPCIVSNISSLPEVAGDAALYIDPVWQESIYSAVERILTDTTLRETLVLKGRIQLAKFSWERTVAETINLYRTIL